MSFFPPNERITKKKRTAKTFTVPMVREDHDFELYNDQELYEAKGGVLVFDTECYPNYWLCAFRNFYTGKVIYFERTADCELNVQKLLWVLHNFCIVGFNSNYYDLPIVWLALNGAPTETLKNVTNFIIQGGWRPSDVEKAYKFKMGSINHIDLIEVAPLRGSLKAYMSRLHSRRLQDLPFNPDKLLTASEMAFTRLYCINDLEGTADLLKDLSPQLELRTQLSYEYKQDLRSKSDAQIAEAVIATAVSELNGYYSKRPTIEPGTKYKYRVPEYLQYQSKVLQHVLNVVRNCDFEIAENGQVLEPSEFSALKEVQIGHSVYRMGIGGLHSTEEEVSHIATDEIMLIDRDVASYYPNIILNQSLYPKHLGENFLNVYRTIVNRRLDAKKAKDKVVADSLKITINGSFGKLGSKYSSLYSPDLMLQVTVSGQLTLLMLIEAIELAGIPVVSGNTDGIVIKCPVSRYADLNAIVAAWEKVTGFDTEETRYRAVYSRDVNNYLAIMLDGTYKAKGAYSKPGLQKNPTNIICVEAATALIVGNTPIEETITTCRDITKFVTARNVKGGAEKDGVYLGKVVRWYVAKGTHGCINYVINGNKVPKSEGAKPLMDLPPSFPEDIDYDWYINETTSILTEIAFIQKEKQLRFF